MNKLSVVITAYNEENHIEECLKSVGFADEIIVIDNSSTDKTVEIAKKFTKKIFTQVNDPLNIDMQKNFGFGKATNEWILSLDADERVDKELAKEIKVAIQNSVFNAYKLPRKNIIFGKWIEHSFLWPDHQTRLFRKGKGKYMHGEVHQQLAVEGQVGVLLQPLLHENYQSISQYLQKMDRYTENEAIHLVKKNTHFHRMDALRLPVRDFLKTFFLQEGYKDGIHGLVISILQSFYMFLVWAKVWEKQGFVQTVDNKKFLSDIFAEGEKLYSEVTYWFLTHLIEATVNPLKQTKLRIQRKIAKKASERDE